MGEVINDGIFAVRSWEKQMEWNKRIRSMARRPIHFVEGFYTKVQ
jgi:hypothetical protein